MVTDWVTGALVFLIIQLQAWYLHLKKDNGEGGRGTSVSEKQRLSQNILSDFCLPVIS